MSTMIILTDSQLVELNNRLGQIQRLIETAQVIKAGGVVQPKAVTEAVEAPSVVGKRRKAKRKRGALNEQKVAEIKARLAAGNESAQKIADDYGVHFTTVNLIKYGKTWKNVQASA